MPLQSIMTIEISKVERRQQKHRTEIQYFYMKSLSHIIPPLDDFFPLQTSSKYEKLLFIFVIIISK